MPDLVLFRSSNPDNVEEGEDSNQVAAPQFVFNSTEMEQRPQREQADEPLQGILEEGQDTLMPPLQGTPVLVMPPHDSLWEILLSAESAMNNTAATTLAISDPALVSPDGRSRSRQEGRSRRRRQEQDEEVTDENGRPHRRPRRLIPRERLIQVMQAASMILQDFDEPDTATIEFSCSLS